MTPHAVIDTGQSDAANPDGWRVLRVEVIACPNCNAVQRAGVCTFNGAAWPVLVHVCVNPDCRYTVTEAEWNPVFTGVVS